MSQVATAIHQIKQTLPPGVTLVAVSKFHSIEKLSEAYDAGQRVFGESRAQEVVPKSQTLTHDDIEWHFIGHLQPNKVKMIAPFVTLIHSVDSLKLLKEINKQSAKVDRKLHCLLEVKVAAEDSKHGLTPEACLELLREGEWREMANISIDGLMCMATNTDDKDRIRQDFAQAHALFKQIKQEFFADAEHFSIRSWGMSDDYEIAIEEGSNMIRVGSAIFGERM